MANTVSSHRHPWRLLQIIFATINQDAQRKFTAKSGNNLLQCAKAHIVGTFKSSVGGLRDVELLRHLALGETGLTAYFRQGVLTVHFIGFGFDPSLTFRRHLRPQLRPRMMSAHFVSIKSNRPCCCAYYNIFFIIPRWRIERSRTSRFSAATRLFMVAAYHIAANLSANYSHPHDDHWHEVFTHRSHAFVNIGH